MKTDSIVLGRNSITQTKVKTVVDSWDNSVKVVKVFNRLILEKKKRFVNIDNSGMRSESAWDDALAELSHLKALNHPHVLELLNVEESETKLKLYFPRHKHCVMTDVGCGKFHPTLGDQLTAQMIHRMICQISSALEYLNSESVAHRDVKPNNILISFSNEFVLSDFGSARAYRGFTRESPATLAFFPPEISCESHDPFKADIWALGVSAWCCVFQSLPYEADFDEPSSVLAAIASWDIQSDPRRSQIPSELRELFRITLDRIAENRIYQT